MTAVNTEMSGKVVGLLVAGPVVVDVAAGVVGVGAVTRTAADGWRCHCC